MLKEQKKSNARAQLWAVAIVVIIVERPAGGGRGQQPLPSVRHTRLLAA
jgi:hypothetical protein